MKGGLAVTVEGTTVVRLVTSPPIAAKVLPGPVLLLIGSAAGLLAGDTVVVRVDLAAGARLTVRTTAATIAHPCRGGGSTRFEVDCRLGEGALLDWLPEPLIACAGCQHWGRAHLALGPGAVATWLDTLALGRSGEEPGDLRLRLDVELDGRPLLREGLAVGPSAPGWDGPAVLGDYRHVAALHRLGARVNVDQPGLLQLAGIGTTARFVARRGDELARQVTAALPLFLAGPPVIPSPKGAESTESPEIPKEAIHV